MVTPGRALVDIMHKYASLFKIILLSILVPAEENLQALLGFTQFKKSRLFSFSLVFTRLFSYFFGKSTVSKLFNEVIRSRIHSSFSEYFRSLALFEKFISNNILYKHLSIYPSFKRASTTHSYSLDFSKYNHLPLVILGPTLDLTQFDLASITHSPKNVVLLSNLNGGRPLGSLSSNNIVFSFYNHAVAKRIPDEISHLLDSRLINGAIFRNLSFASHPIYSQLENLYSLSSQNICFPMSSLMGFPCILSEILNNSTFCLSRPIYVMGFSLMTGPVRYSPAYGNIRGSDLDLHSLRIHDAIAQYSYVKFAISHFVDFHCDDVLRDVLKLSVEDYLKRIDLDYSL